MRQRFFPGCRSRRTAAVVRRRAPSLEFLENRIVLTQLAYGLFDSGVDANGNALTTVGSQDPHWTLPVTQTGTNGMNAVTASLANGWVPNSATDAWISPTSSDQAAPGLYTYHTTFNVPSVGGRVSLTGSLTGADDVVDFQINGASTGYSRTSAYTGFLPFRVNGGVSVGTNTLDVIVRNGPGNPNATGFHIKSLVLNYLPNLTVDHSVETTASGGTVTNSGSFDDPDSSDNVTITSSRGTITQNGAHSGTFTYSESNVTTGGMVTVTATDSRGATRTQPFTTNIATATPTVTNPASQVSVNTSTYNIQGTAAVQSLVQVYDDANKDGVLDAGDTVVASQQLAGGGTTFSIAAPLTSKAVNDFLVTATAPSNSESNAMVVLAITQDAIAPSAPTVITPSAPESVKAATAIVTGTAEAGALVRISRAGVVVASQQLAGTATSFSIVAPLTANAANDFLVTASDAAGNESATAAVPTITQDSVAPVGTTGTVQGGGTTDDASTDTLRGTAEAGSLVRIYRAGEVVGSVQLAPGQTSYSITVPLVANAANDFVITATDAAGNQSAPIHLPTVTQGSTTPMIHGTVFLDVNANGVLDPGEAGLAGRFVFVDLNHDGILDAGDPSAVTDARGNFAFPGIATGSAGVVEAADKDSSDRNFVDQFQANSDGGMSIGVVPISAVAPVPVVPSPFAAAPGTDPNAAFVQSLYHSVLGRTGGDSEVALWSGAMSAGMTRQEAAEGVINSPEHRLEQVYTYYQQFLHRAPDPASITWVDQLLSGVSEEKVVKAILDSPEYQSAQQDPALYVRDLYIDVLGRQGQPSERDGWLAQLAGGESRQAIMAEFVGSPEARGQIVASFDSAYLRRPADSTSQGWVDALASPDGSATDVAVGFLAGDEFFDASRRGGR